MKVPGIYDSRSAVPHFLEPADTEFDSCIDGSIQRYVEMLPVDFIGAKKHDVLIALHGHGADRWQFIRDDRDECRAARDVAGRRGMIYVSPDYRAPDSWMGPKAEADILQIIGLLRSKYHIGRIFLTGGSMGGASSLTFGAIHPELIAGVASQNGTANHLEYAGFQDAISKSYGGTKVQIPLEYKKRSAEYWPEAFIMPVAITAGGRDDVVPSDSVVRLAGILDIIGRKPLLIFREDGGHSADYADTDQSLEYIIDNAYDG